MLSWTFLVAVSDAFLMGTEDSRQILGKKLRIYKVLASVQVIFWERLKNCKTLAQLGHEVKKAPVRLSNLFCNLGGS